MPANSSRAPSALLRTGLFMRLCASAPASAPAAFRRPKPKNTRRSTCPRIFQRRMAVAMACGTETADTASFVPYWSAISGVRMLPTPKPATDAIAPAIIAIAATAALKPTPTPAA